MLYTFSGPVCMFFYAKNTPLFLHILPGSLPLIFRTQLYFLKEALPPTPHPDEDATYMFP